MPYSKADDKRAWARRYYAANKERVFGYSKNWRDRNPTYMKEWKERNAEKVREYRRSARKKYGARAEKILCRDDLREFYKRKKECGLCGSVDGEFHIDHIVPKSRGGSNELSNIRWLCRQCNVSKNGYTDEEFISHIKRIIGFTEGRKLSPKRWSIPAAVMPAGVGFPLQDEYGMVAGSVEDLK